MQVRCISIDTPNPHSKTLQLRLRRVRHITVLFGAAFCSRRHLATDRNAALPSPLQCRRIAVT